MEISFSYLNNKTTHDNSQILLNLPTLTLFMSHNQFRLRFPIMKSKLIKIHGGDDQTYMGVSISGFCTNWMELWAQNNLVLNEEAFFHLEQKFL